MFFHLSRPSGRIKPIVAARELRAINDWRRQVDKW
jgi:hypothetical protein